MDFPKKLTAIQISIKTGEYTLPDLVNSYLNEIEKTSDLNIYLEVWKEEALEKATQIQKKINSRKVKIKTINNDPEYFEKVTI